MNTEIIQKLAECNLLEIVKKYCETDGLINIDMDDIKLILKDKKIINHFNGSIDVSGDINFNFIKNENSYTILVVEGNNRFSLKYTEKIVNSIRESIGENNIIYGYYMNDNMKNNIANVMIINTGEVI